MWAIIDIDFVHRFFIRGDCAKKCRIESKFGERNYQFQIYRNKMPTRIGWTPVANPGFLIGEGGPGPKVDVLTYYFAKGE